MRARATIADVAERAGVSLRTASRALTGSPKVAAGTRIRVEAAAAELRFRPSAAARELRAGGRGSALGFVIGDLTNPFYAAVAAGISEEAAQRDVTVLITASGDRIEAERPAVVSMLERRVRALLLIPIATDHHYLDDERALGTPVIAVDRPLSRAAGDAVLFDNRGGTRDGVRALVAAGHRRIGFVGSPRGLYTHGERLRGYLDVVGPDPRLLREDAVTVAEAELATAALLGRADAPDAIFAGNNRALLGAWKAIREVRPGTALLGFDDAEFAEALGISVVAPDPLEMGRVAARLAFDRIDDLDGELREVVLPTRLLLRGSER
jgi:LacI family transcriptional regulator